jgi:hypothetical protein
MKALPEKFGVAGECGRLGGYRFGAASPPAEVRSSRHFSSASPPDVS